MSKFNIMPILTQGITLMVLGVSLLTSCSQVSIEAQQALLEKARAEYRMGHHRAATEAAQQEFQQWQSSLDRVVRAEFYRTEETLGAIVPPVKAVKVSGKELSQLLAILRRGQSTPLADADVLITPGTEPLKINDDGEVEQLVTSAEMLIHAFPHQFYAIDFLHLYDAQGQRIEPLLTPYADIVSRSDAENRRNTWSQHSRPFIMLEDDDFKRYRNLPSYRTFVQRMKKAYARGEWDLTPDFSRL